MIINGEALEELTKLKDNSIELILIDPPYNTIASKWDKYVDFNKFFEIAWEKVTSNGSIIIFASGSFTPRVMLSNIENYKYKYSWIKNNSTNFVHSKNRPMTKMEDILVFSKAPMGHISQIGEERRMIYNPQGLVKCEQLQKQGKSRFGTIAGNRPSHLESEETFIRHFTNYPTDVIDDIPDLAPNRKLHTSEKPVKLLEKLILTHSNNGLVIDCFMGSGSTIKACQNLNRKAIGIELDKEYYEIAKKRLSDLTEQTKLC